jgi:phospholipase/carboxylesterase
MNRLHASAACSPGAAPAADVSAKGETYGAASAKLITRRESPLAMFGPLHYEAGYAYPLIVWLHGWGDDETQLRRVMPLVSMQNFVAVAPRGTRQVPSEHDDRHGFTWPRGKTGATAAQQRIWTAVAAAKGRFHVNPQRIFLAGFDDGGTLAFRTAMDHPDRFAGVLSLCGSFPRQGAPLARLADARRLPVFLACGRHSRKYSAQQVCRDLRLFHAAGFDVSLRQYPCGQEIAVAMLADMNRWIMEQIGGVK